MLPVAYASYSGLVGSMSVLFAKSLASLLNLSVRVRAQGGGQGRARAWPAAQPEEFGMTIRVAATPSPYAHTLQPG